MATVGVPSALIAFYEDHEHTFPVVERYEWSELIALLTEHEFTDCAEANGLPAGSPCPGGQSCKAKFTLAFSPGAPREGTSRLNKNVDEVSLLAFDFDHLTRAELEGVTERIAGLTCLLYSTHSHGRGGVDDCCVRIVFPLPRALRPSEFRWVRNKFIAKYGLQWFRDAQSLAPKLAGADPNPKDLSRLYFLPTAPIGAAIEAEHLDGDLIDLAELLQGMPATAATGAASPAMPRVPPPPGTTAPLSPPTVDLDTLRGLLKDYKAKNKERDEGEVITRNELIRRVWAQEPLVRPEEDGQREKSCHRIGKILAYLLPVGTPDEAMVELCRKSISTMYVKDTDGSEDTLDARFQKLDYSWRRGLGEREEQQKIFDAERAQEQQAAGKLRQWLQRTRKGVTAETATFAPNPSEPQADGVTSKGPETEEEEQPPLTEEELRGLLVGRETKNGPVYLACVANVITILSLHPEWEGKIRYNQIAKTVEITDAPLEGFETEPAQVVTGVQTWLQNNFQINFEERVVHAGLVHVAKGNAYNPLHTYLNTVSVGAQPVSRIDTFLEAYCGAALVDVDGNDITWYVRAVSRRWLVACVARALRPGCKMDNVLIFEGKTGIFKSTALRILGGEFFSDSKIVIGEKDAMQLAGTNWLHEIAELSGLNAAETEQQKAFFSSATDQFRAPYDRVQQKYPRLAVFAGSTNAITYLTDETGNRRPWPIRCERPFQIRNLKRDRDVLWAEAVQVYKTAATCLKCQSLNSDQKDWFYSYHHERCDAHRWWFNREENEALERINNHRLKANFSDGIRDYLLRLSPQTRSAHYTLFQIAVDMLKIPAERIASNASAISRALKVLGFTDDVVRDDTGAQHRVWVVPELLAKAPKKMPAHLRVVGQGEEQK